MAITITAEEYRGSCSDDEATFPDVQTAERVLTELFGEPITLTANDYRAARAGR